MMPALKEAAMQSGAGTTPYELIAMGWYLFPVANKMPLVKWTKESSNDEAQIKKWEALRGRTGWGIDCGKSNLAVLDIDSGKVPGAISCLDGLEFEYGELPGTYTVRTPSGGYHRIFRGSIRNSASSKLGSGLDTRGHGGFIVAPGSPGYEVIDHRPLADAPGWLVDLVGRPVERKEVAPIAGLELDSELSIQLAVSYLEDAEAAIENCGGDDHTYRTACRVKDFGVSQDTALELMLDYWNERCCPPWEPDQLATKIRNAYNHGNQPPGVSNPEGVFDEFAESEDSTPAKSIYNLMSVTTEFRTREIQIEYLVDGLVPKGFITLFYAPSGAGKSTIATQLCQAVRDGSSFLNLATQQAEVVYLDYENPDATIVARLRKVRGCEGFMLWTSSHEPPPPQLDEKNRGALEAVRPGTLLVIDTLKACNNSDENSAKEMKPIFDFLKKLRNAGLTILLLHHTTKGPEGTYRGSSVIQDQSDHCISLVKVRRPGDDKEVWEAEDISTYRLGVSGKTRAGMFKTYVRFDADTELFALAEDPGEKEAQKILNVILWAQSDGTDATQSYIIEERKKDGIGKSQVITVLNAFTGKLWSAHKGARNAWIYTPSVITPF